MRKVFVIISLMLLSNFTAADGFHGAMNGDQLSSGWEQNRYSLLDQGNQSSVAGLLATAQNALTHLKYMSRVNIRPQEFPNFKEEDIPGTKSKALQILREIGKPAVPKMVEELISSTGNQSSYSNAQYSRDMKRYEELLRRGKVNEANALMAQIQSKRTSTGSPDGLVTNEDYIQNLRKLIKDIGKDAIPDLKDAYNRASSSDAKSAISRLINEIEQDSSYSKSKIESTDRSVKDAIYKGIGYLIQTQNQDGSWSLNLGGKLRSHAAFNFTTGATGLALLALVKGGLSKTNPNVKRGVEYLVGCISDIKSNTYNTAFSLMALAAIDPARHQLLIKDLLNQLNVTANGAGGWGYNGNYGGDGSNTQIALLALKAALDAGIPINETTRSRIVLYYSAFQNPDGGWGYRPNQGCASYGSMTAAGICGLAIAGQKRYQPTSNCGEYLEDIRISRGLKWLGDHFVNNYHPGTSGVYPFTYYWLYSAERAGILTGERFFGSHDWYQEGASFLLKDQRSDGSWGDLIYGPSDTAFSILFLSKGKTESFFYKLKLGKQTPHRYDLSNLCESLYPVLKKRAGWQYLEPTAPLKEFMSAPVLFITGHDPVVFNEDERKKLKDFTEQGGIIIVEACCGKKEFRESFCSEYEKIFPGQKLFKLSSNHPLYNDPNLIPPQYQTLEGMSGCWTSVIYAPEGISCAWDQGKEDHPNFLLGINIAAYVVKSASLREKGPDPMPELAPPTKLKGRGVMVIGQIKYEGGWDPDPKTLDNLLRYISKRFHIRVSTSRRIVSLTDKILWETPILFMTGHDSFKLSEEEQKNLKQYLESGGFLFAESCCGRASFDTSLRQMIAQIFSENQFKQLSLDHPVFKTGAVIYKVEYKPDLKKLLGNDNIPKLWGLDIGGRIGLIYSPYSLGCSMHGHPCPGCLGLVPDSAFALAANIVIYGANY